MQQYRKLVETILEKGTYKRPARAGMPGSLSYFGYQFRHNLAEGFPLLTTKKVNFKKIVVELLWFLRGDTNIKYLNDNGCDIWNEDAYNYFVKIHKKAYGHEPGIPFTEFVKIICTRKNLAGPFTEGEFADYKWGDCGMQYGKLWREWPNVKNDEQGPDYENKIEYIDQIKDLFDGLMENPEGRRHIISAWNPSTLDQMALNACHALTQFNCRQIDILERDRYAREVLMLNVTTNNGDFHGVQLDKLGVPRYYLDCQMYQRSADTFLGVPFNIASYALLTLILAQTCNMLPGEFIHTFGDVHIYDNHRDAINLQMSREERTLPTVKISNNILNDLKNHGLIETLPHMVFEDFKLEGYDPHPYIKAELSTGLTNKK